MPTSVHAYSRSGNAVAALADVAPRAAAAAELLVARLTEALLKCGLFA
jgi:hypothetical protein